MTIVTTLAELDQLLSIARKHGLNHVKVGDIEAVFGPPVEVKAERQVDTEISLPKDIDAEAYQAYKNL